MNKVLSASGLIMDFDGLLFSYMTVLEDVIIGRHRRNRTGILGAALRYSSTSLEEQEIVKGSYALLRGLDLEKSVNEFARNMPDGGAAPPGNCPGPSYRALPPTLG